MYMYLLLNVWCLSIRAGPLGYGRSCTCLIRVGDTYYTSGKNYCALRGFIGSICNLGSGLEHGKHFIFLHRNVLISKGCCCEFISFCWNERNWVFVNDFFYCALCGFLLQIKQKKISSKFFNFQSELSNHFMQIPSAFCSETIPFKYLCSALCAFYLKTDSLS